MNQIQQQQEAIEELRQLLKPGDTVHTVLRHVSRTGMNRSISPIINMSDYSWLVAKALEERVDQIRGSIRITGCGMDMGFDLVYRLSAHLWPGGFTCTGEGCHSNDHSNGDRNYEPHHHKDGGYALRQRWL